MPTGVVAAGGRAARLALLLWGLSSAGCGGGGGGSTPVAAPEPTPRAAPKLIEMGWDRSTPDKLLASRTNLEASGFDGTTIILHAGLSVFRLAPIASSAMSQDLADLRAFRSTRLNSNFILTWTTPESGWDWFDPQHTTALEKNAEAFAAAAVAGGFKGLFLDTENYGAALWDYRLQVRAPAVSFAAYQQQARIVGRQFGLALQRAMPDVTVLLTWGLVYLEAQFGPSPDAAKMAAHPYGLMPAFLDGVLSVAGPSMNLVELNEAAYGYVNPSDYGASREAFAALSPTLLSAESRSRWANQYQLGQCLFADALLNSTQSARYFGYFMANDAERLQLFKQSIHSAMATGDRYVWVYDNNLDWWKGTVSGPIAQGLADAAGRARAGAPLGFDLATAVERARPRFDARVALSGRISAAPNVQLPRASFAGLTNECGFSDKDGYFACWFEGGWTGSLKPQAVGHVFAPAERPFQGLSKSQGGQDFRTVQ